MKDIGNGDFGSRDGAYTTNKHSGAISYVNSRCITGRVSVGEKGWIRCHVIATSRVKKPCGELTRQDRKSRGRGCVKVFFWLFHFAVRCLGMRIDKQFHENIKYVQMHVG